jgi:tetratricopeptide (TPR) repeat protein
VPLWTDDFASLFQILCSEQRPDVDPYYGKEQTIIATRLCGQGDFGGAIHCYRKALEVHPNMLDLLNNLAWLLATCPDPRYRNGAQAIELGEKACQLTHYRQTPLIGTLAAAYAEAGRFDYAIWTAEKACACASESGDQDLARRNQDLQVLYRAHQAYHE